LVLKDDWIAATSLSSSTTEIVFHPSYQQIIGLGPQAIPLILSELRRRARQWFWALSAIVGYDAAEGAESPSEAARRWLAWGENSGYVGRAE